MGFTKHYLHRSLIIPRPSIGLGLKAAQNDNAALSYIRQHHNEYTPKWFTQTIGDCTPPKINERLTNWCGAQGSLALPQQLDNGRTRSQSGTSQTQSLCCWKNNASARQLKLRKAT